MSPVSQAQTIFMKLAKLAQTIVVKQNNYHKTWSLIAEPQTTVRNHSLIEATLLRLTLIRLSSVKQPTLQY